MDINKLTYELIKDLVPEDYTFKGTETKIANSSNTLKRKKLEIPNLLETLEDTLEEEIAASEAYRNDTALKTIIQGKRNVGYFSKVGGVGITYEDVLKQVKKHNLKILPVEGSDYGAYIVYRPEGEQDAVELKKIAEKYGGYLAYRATDEDTRRIGELLGYKKEDIDNFIKEKAAKLAAKTDTESTVGEAYKGKKTDNGAPGTFKAKITKAYGGDVTIEKAKKFKNRENATALDKQQANWFINFHSKNENLNEVGEANLAPYKWRGEDVDGDYTFVEFITDEGTEYHVNLEVMNYSLRDTTSYVKALNVEFTTIVEDVGGYRYSSAAVVMNKGELYRVMSTVVAIIKHYVKKYKVEAIMYSASRKSGETSRSQRDTLYKTFITKAIPGVKFEQKGDMVVAILPNTQINELVTDTEVICDNCGWAWKIADGGDDLYICHNTLPGGSVCGHNNDPDLFEAPNPEAGSAIPYGSGYRAVKEYVNEGLYTSGEPADSPVGSEPEATMQDKLEPYLIEITQYMYRQGLNIDPAPEIEFVEDQENAQNVLGKTAYYNPNKRVIVLYTTGRHPKDILRSFAHEMIHHMQNLEGRLENMSGTTNVNEDGYLANIEREAYDNGNMIFRSWENDRDGNNSIHNMRGFTPGSYDMQPSDTN